MNQHTNAMKATQVEQDISHNAMVEIALSDPKNELTQEEKDVRYKWFEQGAKYMLYYVEELLYTYKYTKTDEAEDEYNEGLSDGEHNLYNYLRKKLKNYYGYGRSNYPIS